jgi:hypothetical protein
MPYGMFAGRTLGDLAGSAAGRGYLAWAAANIDGNAGTAAGIVLEALAREAPDGPAVVSDAYQPALEAPRRGGGRA